VIEKGTGGGRVCRAVAAFISESTAAVARRPHELYEVILESCPSRGPDDSLEFSLLGVAAVRQAIRVLGSKKMSSACKAAIAGYVSGADFLSNDQILPPRRTFGRRIQVWQS
jgi:hypothetical protein